VCAGSSSRSCSGSSASRLTRRNPAGVGMVVAADRMAMFGVRVPGEPPAAVNMAVVLAEPDHEGGEQRQLSDVGANPRPELVATA